MANKLNSAEIFALLTILFGSLLTINAKLTSHQHVLQDSSISQLTIHVELALKGAAPALTPNLVLFAHTITK